MEELLYILTKLEENTKAILAENSRLEEEIKVLKGEITEPEEPIIDTDCGLLGKMEDLVFTKENGISVSIENGNIILEGISRYANAYVVYKEKKEDCVPNVLGNYKLHIEGKIEKGCSNAYLNGKSRPLQGEIFSYDYDITSSWQRSFRVDIFLNHSVGENSKMIITSLKLTKAE